MSRIKGIAFIFVVFTLIFSVASVSYSQIPVKKKRIKRERFRKIEIYFDGGYSAYDMSGSDDAITSGRAFMAQFLEGRNDTLAFWGFDTGAVHPGEIEDFENIRTMGGGLNINLNERFGFGLKIMFAQLDAQTAYYHMYEDAEPIIPGIGQVVLDQRETYSTKYRYHHAPIILKAFYKLQPFPEMRDLELIVGGGPGLYTTSIYVDNLWQRDLLNYPPGLFYGPPPVEFARFTDKYVAQPIGLYLFGGFKFKASSAMSISLKAEYNLVPDATLKSDKWGVGKDFEHTFTLDNDEWVRPYYVDVFSAYHPEKLNISSFRIGASVHFAF